jgi:hypothetical protein
MLSAAPGSNYRVLVAPHLPTLGNCESSPDVCVRGTHPCKGRKDGAPTAGVISARNERMGHPSLNKFSPRSFGEFFNHPIGECTLNVYARLV